LDKAKNQFWGEILIRFQNGIPVLVQTTETKKLTDSLIRKNHNKAVLTKCGKDYASKSGIKKSLP
jgi:hypothetical protein